MVTTMMLGEQFPDELNALQLRAREMSEQLGVEIVVDHVGVKGGRVIGALKPADGSMMGIVYVAVPTGANKRKRWWRGGDAA
jgi:hypothetical protein